MFGWLRDTVTNTAPKPLSHPYSAMSSTYLRQQNHQHHRRHHHEHEQQQQQQRSNQRNRGFPLALHDAEDDQDNDDDDEENYNRYDDKKFYHNPYHSSGQMNYIDIPHQQYYNQHAYPTYLAREQIINQSLDDQIHAKLFALQQRGNQNSLSSDKNSTMIVDVISLSKDESIPSLSPIEPTENSFDEDQSMIGTSIPVYCPGAHRKIDGKYDFASFVIWYRNVMQSVKKIM